MQFYFVMQLQVSIVHIRRNRCAQRTYMVHDVHASNGSMREHTTRLSERAIIYDDNQMTIICDINSIISNYYVFYVAVVCASPFMNVPCRCVGRRHCAGGTMLYGSRISLVLHLQFEHMVLLAYSLWPRFPSGKSTRKLERFPVWNLNVDSRAPFILITNYNIRDSTWRALIRTDFTLIWMMDLSHGRLQTYTGNKAKMKTNYRPIDHSHTRIR